MTKKEAKKTKTKRKEGLHRERHPTNHRLRWVRRGQRGQIIHWEYSNPQNPIADSRAKARVAESISLRIERRAIKQQPKDKMYRQVQIVKERLGTKDDIKYWQEKVPAGNIINFEGGSINVGHLTDLSKAVKTYQKVLKQAGTKEEDIKGIIENREKTLKHRLSVNVQIMTKDGMIGEIQIGDILLEKEADIRHFWIGRPVNHSTFPLDAEEMRQLIGNPSVFHPSVNKALSGKCTDVQTQWQLA